MHLRLAATVIKRAFGAVMMMVVAVMIIVMIVMAMTMIMVLPLFMVMVIRMAVVMTGRLAFDPDLAVTAPANRAHQLTSNSLIFISSPPVTCN